MSDFAIDLAILAAGIVAGSAPILIYLGAMYFKWLNRGGR